MNSTGCRAFEATHPDSFECLDDVISVDEIRHDLKGKQSVTMTIISMPSSFRNKGNESHFVHFLTKKRPQPTQ